MKSLGILLLAVLFLTRANAQALVREWKPEELARWSLVSAKNPRVENGALVLETAGGDAQLVSPAFEKFVASPWQRIEPLITRTPASAV